jgi:hypothetical protein
MYIRDPYGCERVTKELVSNIDGYTFVTRSYEFFPWYMLNGERIVIAQLGFRHRKGDAQSAKQVCLDYARDAWHNANNINHLG